MKKLYNVEIDAIVSVEVRADSPEEAMKLGRQEAKKLSDRLDSEASNDPHANGDWRLPLIFVGTLDEATATEIEEEGGA